MKRLIALIAVTLPLLYLPACAIFGGLSEAEALAMREHRANSGRYFNARQYEKAADQALKGLALEPDDYDLKDRLGWSYLLLSGQRQAQNVEHLRLAEQTFGELIRWRDLEDHMPGTVLGYAKTLHNRARVEELQAKLLRTESDKPNGNPALAAQADEHTNRAKAYDRQAEHYFKALAEGDVAGRVNKREAYEYLMALRYRAKDLQGAIGYGNKNLQISAAEEQFWRREYGTTMSVKREGVIRNELKILEDAALTVHSRLASYHQELGQHPEAIVHYDAILKANPQSYQDYYLRATCYREQNQHDAARKDFRRFIELSSLPEGHKALKDAHHYLYGNGK
jgi:tetratricopeptide (TPR) repeat protein